MDGFQPLAFRKAFDEKLYKELEARGWGGNITDYSDAAVDYIFELASAGFGE